MIITMKIRGKCRAVARVAGIDIIHGATTTAAPAFAASARGSERCIKNNPCRRRSLTATLKRPFHRRMKPPCATFSPAVNDYFIVTELHDNLGFDPIRVKTRCWVRNDKNELVSFSTYELAAAFARALNEGLALALAGAHGGMERPSREGYKRADCGGECR